MDSGFNITQRIYFYNLNSTFQRPPVFCPLHRQLLFPSVSSALQWNELPWLILQLISLLLSPQRKEARMSEDERSMGGVAGCVCVCEGLRGWETQMKRARKTEPPQKAELAVTESDAHFPSFYPCHSFFHHFLNPALLLRSQHRAIVRRHINDPPTPPPTHTLHSSPHPDSTPSLNDDSSSSLSHQTTWWA